MEDVCYKPFEWMDEEAKKKKLEYFEKGYCTVRLRYMARDHWAYGRATTPSRSSRSRIKMRTGISRSRTAVRSSASSARRPSG